MKRRIWVARVGWALAIAVLGVEAQAQSVQYTYDALGRLSAVTRSQGQTATYTYDAAGNRTVVQTTGTPSPPPTALRSAFQRLAGLEHMGPKTRYSVSCGRHWTLHICLAACKRIRDPRRLSQWLVYYMGL